MSRTCPACRAEVELNAKFCTDCGESLPTENSAPPSRDAGPWPSATSSVPLVPVVSFDASVPSTDQGLPFTGNHMESTNPLLSRELTEAVRAAMPSEAAVGSELVVEVETNRPNLLNHAGLLRFRVTNNLHGPCSVAIWMRFHGQGSYVDQDLAEAGQYCEFHRRGDQRVFSFPFLALRPGDISVQELRLVLSRPDQPDESMVYELPDRSLLMHVLDPALGAGSPGIVISGGIHIDFSQLKELYGADIKNILNLNANREIDPAQAAIKWEPILLRFSCVQTVESLPAELRLALPVRRTHRELPWTNPHQLARHAAGQCKEDERPMHPVRITRDFYLGRYPVTQEQYQAVMGHNPARFAVSPQHPVDNISWQDAQQFCQRFRQYLMQEPAAMVRQGVALDSVRLPSEAQWEYACRAGADTAWCFGDDRNLMPDFGWCEKNSRRATHPVGLLKPNRWGLCDMHGNLWEWCEDFYAPEYSQAGGAEDPTGPAGGERRVLRGGSWSTFARDCRSAARHAAPPDARTANYGLRVVLLVSYRTDQPGGRERLLRQSIGAGTSGS